MHHNRLRIIEIRNDIKAIFERELEKSLATLPSVIPGTEEHRRLLELIKFLEDSIEELGSRDTPKNLAALVGKDAIYAMVVGAFVTAIWALRR